MYVQLKKSLCLRLPAGLAAAYVFLYAVRFYTTSNRRVMFFISVLKCTWWLVRPNVLCCWKVAIETRVNRLFSFKRSDVMRSSSTEGYFSNIFAVTLKPCWSRHGLITNNCCSSGAVFIRVRLCVATSWKSSIVLNAESSKSLGSLSAHWASTGYIYGCQFC